MRATARLSKKCPSASRSRSKRRSPEATAASSSIAFPPADASSTSLRLTSFSSDVSSRCRPARCSTSPFPSRLERAPTPRRSTSVALRAKTGQPGGIQVLRSNELQQLRGVITNDPLRAIHVLPGVATGDDLRSEFSVRGLPVRHMNFTFEGVSTPLLVHTVQGVQDTGSIAMVNGDVLQEIALASGSYPQRYGNNTGAELTFLVREGSRDRLRGNFRPSVTDTSLVLEGPLGRSKKGSWLISARKSYLGSVIRRIDPENTFAFGFYDSQAKLAYELSATHQVELAITAGRSRLDQDPEFVGHRRSTGRRQRCGSGGRHLAVSRIAAAHPDSDGLPLMAIGFATRIATDSSFTAPDAAMLYIVPTGSSRNRRRRSSKAAANCGDRASPGTHSSRAILTSRLRRAREPSVRRRRRYPATSSPA